ISGASAGAMNATALTHGLGVGGRQGARDALRAFWHRVAASAQHNPFSPTLLERLAGLDDVRLSAGRAWLEAISRSASPYDLNPSGHNPLADVLADSIDFEMLRREPPLQLFLSATNVRTGRVGIFGPEEISLEAVLASACLPQLFQAVEIDGEHYWDGGYVSNPPLRPLVERTNCADILIVQVDPIRIEQVPTTAQAIRDRIQVLMFNAGFMHEMDDIAANGRTRLHLIEAEAELAKLGAASKLNVGRDFLERLFVLGRARTDLFLAERQALIGTRSTLDVATRF
uniref:patatin-like phospholipase family protein n=1 Tax=Geminicoccus flavidas TaxID=2506407 RepID=UPI00135C380D